MARHVFTPFFQREEHEVRRKTRIAELRLEARGGLRPKRVPDPAQQQQERQLAQQEPCESAGPSTTDAGACDEPDDGASHLKQVEQGRLLRT